MPRAFVHAVLLVGLLGGLLFTVAPEADAARKWRNFNGRMAPDLTFNDTALGLKAGTRLSSFRGREVVLLVFWLRDCQHCKRELPKAQRLHERNARSGLRVISICHAYPLKDVTPLMAKRGWTFPVVRDPKGTMAAYYGGGRRPGFFLIGIDGRVKSSNSLAPRMIETELGKWRLAELGAVPAELKTARERVFARDYGAALRAAEEAGRKPGISAEVRAAIARLTTIAGRKLQIRVDRADTLHKRGFAERAAQEYRGIVAAFTGTSLESRAKALQKSYLSRTRSP